MTSKVASNLEELPLSPPPNCNWVSENRASEYRYPVRQQRIKLFLPRSRDLLRVVLRNLYCLVFPDSRLEALLQSEFSANKSSQFHRN